MSSRQSSIVSTHTLRLWSSTNWSWNPQIFYFQIFIHKNCLCKSKINSDFTSSKYIKIHSSEIFQPSHHHRQAGNLSPAYFFSICVLTRFDLFKFMIILIILTHLVTSQIHLLLALSLSLAVCALLLTWRTRDVFRLEYRRGENVQVMFEHKKKIKICGYKNILILISAESCCACWLGNKKIQFIKNGIFSCLL